MLPAGQPRIPAIDILRGIAIAAVVAIHVTWFYAQSAGFGTSAGRALLLVHLLSGFGVPLFLTLSAAGLALRNAEPAGISAYVASLRKRAARLVPPYVVWSLVTLALYRPASLGSPIRVARILLNGTADAQFYFIPLLFEIYVGWPLLQPIVRSAARSTHIAWATSIAGTAITVGWWRVTIVSSLARNLLLVPMLWLAYVTLGAAVAPHMAAVRRWASRPSALAAAAAASLASLYWNYHSVIAGIGPPFGEDAVALAVILFRVPALVYNLSVMSLLIFLAIRLQDSSVSRAFMVLGSHSYGIFLVHLIVVRTVLRIAPPAVLARASIGVAIANAMLCWAGCLMLSAAFVAVVSRSNWTRALVSNRDSA